MSDNGVRIEQVPDLPQPVPSSAPVPVPAGAELVLKLLHDILAELGRVKGALQSLAGTVGAAMQQQPQAPAAPPSDDDLVARIQRAQRIAQMMQQQQPGAPAAAAFGAAPSAPPAGLVAQLRGCSPAHPWATQGCAACATTLRTALFGGG